MKSLRKLGLAIAAVGFAWVGSGSAQAAETLIFDWQATTPATTPVAGFAPAPFVNNSNAAAVAASLAAYQAANPGRVAVKITEPLTAGNINTLFGPGTGYQINYAFLDIEGAGATTSAQAQANLIHNAAKGSSTLVGNFRLFPGNGDNSGFAGGPSLADYQSGPPKGVNMANADLYPGSPYYKDPAAAGGTSTSPNIRSSLFTLPLKRLTYVTSNMPAGNLNIPYVNRFNNFQNPELDTDGNAANGYQFVQNAADPTKGQLLSRGDFKALVAHYRLRGADGIHLLDGGIQGYTQTQFEQDGKDGWSGITAINDLFKASDASIATLDTTIKVGGVKTDFEKAGVVFSGVYSLSQNKLALLVSNMTDSPTTVGFPARLGNKSVPDVNINEGEHLLLTYTGVGTQWQLASTSALFTSAAEQDRNGVGVPEPMAFASLALVGVASLLRRGRRAK